MIQSVERACRVQVMALQTGRELAVIPDEVAAKTEKQYNDFPYGFAEAHFEALKAILDKEEPEYRS
jgi:ribulose-5-phosphate 4-epimerase/fuculose-1-phosphate aldolase